MNDEEIFTGPSGLPFTKEDFKEVGFDERIITEQDMLCEIASLRALQKRRHKTIAGSALQIGPLGVHVLVEDDDPTVSNQYNKIPVAWGHRMVVYKEDE